MRKQLLLKNPDPSDTTPPLPFVSIVMPVYNEERYIGPILLDLLKQDYPEGKFEIVVADGISSDRTVNIVKSIQAEHPNVVLIDNPGRIVSTGLNLAMAKARGEIIVRVDGHCEYPRNYVRRAVQLRQEIGADNVGGVLVPIGSGYIQRSVAAAYHSKVGVGGAALRASPESATVTEVDAVHGGCWRRDRLLAIGGFDETMVRNQDDELSFRLRKSSGKIVQTSELRVKYHVRKTYDKLFMQFAQYGYWKVQVVRKHPQQASVRHFVPAAFVLLLVCSLVASLFFDPAIIALAVLMSTYLLVLGIATLIQLRKQLELWPGVMAALATMHFGYGLGFIAGSARQLLGPLPSDKVFERVTR